MIEPAPAERFDVCVIGAGPAGSTLASRLAQLGHRVCIVERTMFPRAHVGESLSPGVWSQFDVLGVRRNVEQAGFWPCQTSLTQWSGDEAIRRRSTSAGLLVDRGRFDALLLDYARAQGVRVMQPAALRARSRQDHGWRLAVECTNWTYAIDTDYLVDASGRWSVLGGRKQRAGDRTLAIYGYWRGRFLPCEPKIESAPEAWYWGVPLPDGTYNVMAFVGLAAYRSQRFASLSAAYDKFIGRTSLMAGMLDARLVGPVRATDASAYLDPDNIGPGWIKIGEAALALDPLSSTGVQNAITTALSGSIVVNTLLRRAEQAETAMQFYRTRLRQFSQRHQRWAAELYATALPRHRRPFWEARAASPVAAAEPIPARFDLDRPPPNALRVGLASGVILEEEPCIIGDFIAPRLALRHPNLERPVAFVGGSEVAHLLRPLYPGITLGALMDAWPISATPKTAIAGWLLSHGVLEPYTSTTRVVACS
jgi:flavin-dependent dehydrogenase